MTDKEKARLKFLQALPHFRLAMEMAKEAAGPEGKVGLGIIAIPTDGNGHITAQFHGDEFFEDLATLIDAPPATEDDEMEAKAQAIVDRVRQSGGVLVDEPVGDT